MDLSPLKLKHAPQVGAQLLRTKDRTSWTSYPIGLPIALVFQRDITMEICLNSDRKLSSVLNHPLTYNTLFSVVQDTFYMCL